MAIVHVSNKAGPSPWVVGNDTTGDGLSETTPYLTVDKAISVWDYTQANTLLVNGVSFNITAEWINQGPVSWDVSEPGFVTTFVLRSGGTGSYGLRLSSSASQNNNRSLTILGDIILDCTNCTAAGFFVQNGTSGAAILGLGLGSAKFINMETCTSGPISHPDFVAEATMVSYSLSWDGVTLSGALNAANQPLVNFNILDSRCTISCLNTVIDSVVTAGRANAGSVFTCGASTDPCTNFIIDGVTGDILTTGSTSQPIHGIVVLDVTNPVIDNISYDFTCTDAASASNIYLQVHTTDSGGGVPTATGGTIDNVSGSVTTAGVAPFGLLIGSDNGVTLAQDVTATNVNTDSSGDVFSAGHGLMIGHADNCQIINSSHIGAAHGCLIKHSTDCDARGVAVSKCLTNGFFRKGADNTNFRQCVHIVESGFEARTMYTVLGDGAEPSSGDTDNIATLIKAGSSYSGDIMLKANDASTVDYHNCNIFSEDGTGQFNSGTFADGASTGLTFAGWQALGNVIDCTNIAFDLTEENRMTASIEGFSWTGHGAANDPDGVTYTTPPIIGVFALSQSTAPTLTTPYSVIVLDLGNTSSIDLSSNWSGASSFSITQLPNWMEQAGTTGVVDVTNATWGGKTSDNTIGEGVWDINVEAIAGEGIPTTSTTIWVYVRR